MKTTWLYGALIGALAWAGSAFGAPETLAYDEAGNYTVSTFTNGANKGTGFGAWNLWGTLATLGDSTAGGGGDLNSTNGYSFRFMGDGTGGWCNGRRDIEGGLRVGEVLSFTFTYNWDGGGRGVDVFCSTGQFANLIDVTPGNTFKVNQAVVSTEWSPGAVVDVEITQLADGIQVHLTRATNGTENLNYTTNILNAEPATGFSLYCGGYTGTETNYAIFMNDIQIAGEPRKSLTFTSGTWNPQTVGDYAFGLAREGAVGDEIVLTSDNTNALTVPASVTFVSNSISFDATVASVTAGSAKIVASNVASGAWAEYMVTPVPPTLSIGGAWQVYATGPQTYTLSRSGAVGDTIELFSSDPSVLTVPVDLLYGAGITQTTFNATILSMGSSTIRASNVASGAWAEFNVTVSEPSLVLTGPATARVGETKVYTLTRNGPIGNDVNLSSSDEGVLSVPRGVSFDEGAGTVTFQAEALDVGTADIGASNDDATATPLSVTVSAAGVVHAYDEAGNYTPATYTNGSNQGTGFGAWSLWGTPATLGDSTAGGGGNLNSTNGYSFRFMGDGAGSYCNGRRDFAEALWVGDVVSFTFTYNWDGGGRGVDIFSGDGVQFANLIDVSPGNTFKVNGATISTEYSPGAVVDVSIEQLSNGIALQLTRSVGGTPNLTYATNILHGDAATGVSMYCGGYTGTETNYAIFMNDLQIAGPEHTRLTFTGGTWNPSALGAYPFELTREGSVGDEIVLTSDNPASVTVPASTSFAVGADTVSFNVTVVSLTNGDATVVASNVASGAWAEYTVRPYESTEGPAFGGDLHMVAGDLVFTVPVGYDLGTIYGADCALTGGNWVWEALVLDTDYTVSGTQVTLLTDGRKIIRVGFIRQ